MANEFEYAPGHSFGGSCRLQYFHGVAMNLSIAALILNTNVIFGEILNDLVKDLAISLEN